MNARGTPFFLQLQQVRKLLVVDLGFLGDTVHMIPALWSIREGLPDVELHVMVAAHVTAILEVCPWIDRVIGYPRFPKGPRWYQDFGRIRRLRQSRYDAVINLNGSDRSSTLSWATGAPLRLGRMPPKPSWFWHFLHTETVSVPFRTMPTYYQRWHCLKAAGFPSKQPDFHVQLPSDSIYRVKETLTDNVRFLHVSPCTTSDIRELPLPLLAEALNRLVADDVFKIVLSCAPNKRECIKLNQLVDLLSFDPWRIYAGSLSLLQLTALIHQSTLHLGGDSGALHIALMMGVPTVAWFRHYDNGQEVEWLPGRPVDRVLFGNASKEGLEGITAAQLITSTREVLKGV